MRISCYAMVSMNALIEIEFGVTFLNAFGMNEADLSVGVLTAQLICCFCVDTLLL